MVRQVRKTQWVAYEMVPLAPEVGPFPDKQSRDNFFFWLTRRNPELAGRRIECIEEYVPGPDDDAEGKPV